MARDRPEEFSARVHAFLRTVPPGRVTTYGEVAFAVGCPGAARAVGRIMAQAAEEAPYHRVVRSDGRVAPGPAGRSLARRLRAEGVTVGPDGRIPGFAALRWP